MKNQVESAQAAFQDELANIRDYNEFIKQLDNKSIKEKMIYAYQKLLED